MSSSRTGTRLEVRAPPSIVYSEQPGDGATSFNTRCDGIFYYPGYSSRSDMETVEVKILNYVLHFRQLSWREESAIRFEKGGDRLRTILCHALVEVSGLKMKSREEAMKVLRVLPPAVVQRCFIMYKGSFPMPRRFATMGLYKATEPGKFVMRVAEIEEQRDRIMDRVEQEFESKFGKQELHEQLELERQMAKNSKMRGATKATPDTPLEDRVRRDVEDKTGTMPPIKQGFIGKKDAN